MKNDHFYIASLTSETHTNISHLVDLLEAIETEQQRGDAVNTIVVCGSVRTISDLELVAHKTNRAIRLLREIVENAHTGSHL